MSNERYKDNQYRPSITRREMELNYTDPTGDEATANADLEIARKRQAARKANA